MKLLASAAASIATAALVLAIIAIFQGPPAATSTATESAAPIHVELSDFAIRPTELAAPAGTRISFAVHNAGGTQHDFVIDGVGQTQLVTPGGNATLAVGPLQPGHYTVHCSVPGHADLGMRAMLMVGAASMGGAAAAPVAGAARMTAAQMDASYMASLKAFPAKTKGIGGVPLPPVLDNGVKVFELTASQFPWEVAPGEIRQAMGYNEMVPGPAIRVKLGDRVRIILHNKLDESTAMHFHGLTVPNEMDGLPGVTQPLIQPGQSYTYEFTVRNVGSNMYHSHMNGATQIPAGLLGPFIVEGPNEPQVDTDMTMVLNDGPLGYTLNGKGFPATQPIVATRGQRVRIRYMNEGLQIHPMHLHGLAQTLIARDGRPVAQPDIEDTVLVAPGQRVDVIVEATEVGTWAFHCHILSHAETETGMYGMVTVFVVKER